MSKCLLLLEDDHFSRVMLAVVLRAQGYEVLEAASGTAATQLAESHPVDLAILSLTDNAPDAVEVLERLQALGGTPSILLTNGADRSLLRRARRCGAASQLEKPADIKGLLSLIDQALTTAPA